MITMMMTATMTIVGKGEQMTYHWKPLDVRGLRLYKVLLLFQQHPQWDTFRVIAAKSPSDAQALIEKAEADTQWIEQPVIVGAALSIYQPRKWSYVEEEEAEQQTMLEKFEDKIEDIIAEFGDDPAQCLMIIGEHIELARHYRAHPNAPREGL